MNSGMSFNTTLVKVSELENCPDPSLPVWLLLLIDRRQSQAGLSSIDWGRARQATPIRTVVVQQRSGEMQSCQQ